MLSCLCFVVQGHVSGGTLALMIDAFFRQTTSEILPITILYLSPAGPLIEVLARLVLASRAGYNGQSFLLAD